ncbi:unknown [Clostridium sp. CAG:594]|nr:unknown [Clostridium sp. CAG:594]
MHKRMSSHGDYERIDDTINLINEIKADEFIFNCGNYKESKIYLIKCIFLKIKCILKMLYLKNMVNKLDCKPYIIVERFSMQKRF